MTSHGGTARYWAGVLWPIAATGLLAWLLPMWVALVAVAGILLWPRREKVLAS